MLPPRHGGYKPKKNGRKPMKNPPKPPSGSAGCSVNYDAVQYTACSFALGRGEYCKGDVRFPETHSTKCPRYLD